MIAWLGSASLSANSRASHFVTFAQWSQFLIDTGVRTDDPTKSLRAPRFPKGVPRPLTVAEVRHLLDQAVGRARTYVLLGAYQGLRVHEMAKLRGCYIDEDHLRVLDKGGKTAVLPTHPLVWAEAAEYPTKGFWFPSDADPRTPVRSESVSQTVSRAMEAAGIDGSAHQLRHLYGTQVLRAAGGNLRVTQELLRHASPATTALYTLIDDGQRRSAVMALPDYTSTAADAGGDGEGLLTAER